MVSISKDIRGSDYAKLIAEACRRYARFSLVWRDQLEFDAAALSLKKELKRFETSRAHTDTWPGTRLIGHKADVITYSIAAAATGVLLRPGSLFGWLTPRFPEDLAFYTADGSCAIETIAHESDAIFHDDDLLPLLPPGAKPKLAKGTQ